MSNNELLSRLESLLTPSVESLDLFLEGVVLTGPPGRRVLRITVDLADGPGGVGSDALETLTRDISELLDADDPIKGAYNLEVTTPGVDRPLTTARHFSRNIDRLVKATVTEGDEQQTFTGRVVGVAGQTITFSTDTGEKDVDLGQITSARVEIEFRPRSKAGKRGN